MTKAQIEWAKQHDWFVGIITIDGIDFISVRDVQYDRATKQISIVIIEWFDTFSQLRHWAGY